MFISRGILPTLFAATLIMSVDVSAAGLSVAKCEDTLVKQSDDEKWNSLKNTILKCRTTVQKEIDAGNQVSAQFKESLVTYTQEHNENARKAIASALYFNSDGKLDKKQQKNRDQVRKALKKLYGSLNGSGKKSEKSLSKALASVDKALKKFSATQYTDMRNQLAGQIGTALTGAAIEKFNVCVEKLSNSNFEKNIIRCGGLLQAMLDEKQTVDFDALLTQLNNKIATVNNEAGTTSLPYELYQDTIDSSVGKNIKLINNLRTYLRQYRALDGSVHNERATELANQKNGGLAGSMLVAASAQKQQQVYSQLEQTLQTIKQKIPAFNVSDYETTIATIKATYENSNSSTSYLVALKASISPLNAISENVARLGTGYWWSGAWRKILPLENVKKVANSNPSGEMKAALDAFNVEYKKAQTNTEKEFLTPLLSELASRATTYEDTERGYFDSEYPDGIMVEALEELQEKIQKWTALLPESPVVLQYSNNFEQTLATHKKNMAAGHKAHKERVLAAIDSAEVPTTSYPQDTALQESINEQAKKYFESKEVTLKTVLGEEVIATKVMMKPKQSQNWGTFKNDLGIPTARATNFITVIKDANGDCHALSLRIDGIYTGGGTWGDSYINKRITQDYPLKCSKL